MSTADAKHFRDLLSFSSRGKYLAWRLTGAHKPITLKLKSGLVLRIRSGSATDYGVAWDIFLRRCYCSPEPLSQVHSIVDLGANVGYSCLFWCEQYPEAHITAFEPHPRHVTAIAGNLEANHFTDRVKLVEAAAGVSEQTAFLTDGGSSSALSKDASGYSVPVVDVFQVLDGPIDLLKIDIEGSEYGLLGDERFASLRPHTIVLEWHKTQDFADGREWCEKRLQSFGYRTRIGTEDLPLAGLIWGFRTD